MSHAVPPAPLCGSGPDAPATPSLDVLIIVHHELTSARLETIVRACGHGALYVSSIEQARHAMKAVYFPILIVDRIVGDGDGIDLCREYRALYPQKGVYIMILSALRSKADFSAGMPADADDYVSSHATDVQLIARLRLAAAVMKLTPK